MANLTSAINIQVDSDTKKQATDILNNLGLSMSTAINIFLKQVIKRDGIPFEIVNNKPNEEMLKAHSIQTDLIVKEAGGESIEVGLIMVHSQDHLMTSMLAQELIIEMIQMYKNQK